MSETIKARLTMDVTFSLNGESATEILDRLRLMCGRAIGEGMLTGETNAEVDEFSIDASIRPELQVLPRVLVVVSGGVADPICDEGVDVQVFDWDNYKDDPKNTECAPAHFSDLANQCNVPVAAQ